MKKKSNKKSVSSKNHNGERAKRTPLDRAFQIIEFLQDGSYANAAQIAKKLKISKKTARGDLALLQDKWKLPMDYDPHKKIFFFTRPITDFVLQRVTARELLVICILGKKIDQHQDSQWQPIIAAAFAKMICHLDKEDRQRLVKLNSMVSIRPYAPDDTDLEMVEVIIKGMGEGRAVLLDYLKTLAIEPETRVVHPIHLVEYLDRWYVLAECQKAKEIRTFVPNRMKKVELFPQKFTAPAFDVKKHFAKSMGVHVGKGDHKVVIELDENATSRHGGRSFHAVKSWVKKPGGRSTVTFQLSSFEEVISFVLSEREHAVVIHPPELRAQLRETIGRMGANYEETLKG